MTDAQWKGTISIQLVQEALLVAVERGMDPSAVLQEARIDSELFSSPRARVPAAAYARLWEALADAMDDEFFGMDSHPLRRGSFRLMCHASLSSDTLGHALQRILLFLRVALDDLYGDLRVEGGLAWITVNDGRTPRRMFTYATWLMLVHGLACWLVGRRIPLLEAKFRCAEPAPVSDYRARFCEAATFGMGVTEICIDSKLLDLKVIQTTDSLRTFLQDAPANLLVKYRNDATVASRIRRRLRSQLPEDWPPLEALARVLCMSSTTLQRKLQAEGQSYQRLKDDLRMDIAIELLSNASLPVSDVGVRIGFQETSSFHRAFKKWTGVSPGAYRRSAETLPRSEKTPTS